MHPRARNADGVSLHTCGGCRLQSKGGYERLRRGNSCFRCQVWANRRSRTIHKLDRVDVRL